MPDTCRNPPFSLGYSRTLCSSAASRSEPFSPIVAIVFPNGSTFITPPYVTSPASSAARRPPPFVTAIW